MPPKDTAKPTSAAAASSAVQTNGAHPPAFVSLYVEEFKKWSTGQVRGRLILDGVDGVEKRNVTGAGDTIVITGARKMSFGAFQSDLYAVAGVTFQQLKKPADDKSDILGHKNFANRVTRDGVCTVENTGFIAGEKNKNTALYKLSISIQDKATGEEGFFDPGIENEE